MSSAVMSNVTTSVTDWLMSSAPVSLPSLVNAMVTVATDVITNATVSLAHASVTKVVMPIHDIIFKRPRTLNIEYNKDKAAIIGGSVSLIALLLLFVVESLILQKYNKYLRAKQADPPKPLLVISPSTKSFEMDMSLHKPSTKFSVQIFVQSTFASLCGVFSRSSGKRNPPVDSNVRYSSAADASVKFTVGCERSDSLEDKVKPSYTPLAFAMEVGSPCLGTISCGSNLLEESGIKNPGFEPNELDLQPAVLVIEQERGGTKM